MKHWPNQLVGSKGFELHVPITAQYLRKSGQKLKQEQSWELCRKAACWMASQATSALFYIPQDLPTVLCLTVPQWAGMGWDGMGPPTSIEKVTHRYCLLCWRHLLGSASLLLEDSIEAS